MRLQMPFSDEAFAAALERADVRPVVGVRTHMSLQIASLAKVLHAVRVRAEQHLIGRRLAPQDLEVALAKRDCVLHFFRIVRAQWQTDIRRAGLGRLNVIGEDHEEVVIFLHRVQIFDEVVL